MFRLTKETKNKIVMDAEIFIVPNHACRVSDNKLEYGRELWKSQWLDVNDNTIMVEVWATNKDVDNLMCNKWSDDLMSDENLKDFEYEVMENRIRRQLPNHFPADLLKELDDGDIFYLETPSGVSIELTCNQKDYRYNYDSFHNVFNKVVAHYNS